MVKMCHVPLEAPRCTVDRNPTAMYGHSHNMGLTFWDRKERGVEEQRIFSVKINLHLTTYTHILCKKTNL